MALTRLDHQSHRRTGRLAIGVVAVANLHVIEIECVFLAIVKPLFQPDNRQLRGSHFKSSVRSNNGLKCSNGMVIRTHLPAGRGP